MIWSKEKCQEVASAFKYKKDFRKKYAGAYNFSLRNNILDEICSHMVIERKIKGYWTKEKCQEDALKYEHRRDFSKQSPGSYNASKKNNWLDEICSHMKTIGNKYKRCIYLCEFSNDSIYVGLTYNFNKRKIEHLNDKKSSVYKYMKKINMIPKITKITQYLNIELAQEKEDFFVKFYTEKGYIILNKAKTGSLGAVDKKWEKENSHHEALKYDNRTDFQRNSSGAYHWCRRNNYLNDVCSHMIKRDNIKWTYAICKTEALKYSFKKDFLKKSNEIYNAAKRNGWFDELTSHMGNSRIKWTYDVCKKETLKYNSKQDLKSNSMGVYNTIYRNKWVTELCSHMNDTIKSSGYWTFENCKKESLKYTIKKDFKKHASGAYSSAYKNMWLDELCSVYEV